jgi:hypothetical protein
VRTTLTLDDDVAARLKTEVRRTGKAFKQAVNDALRAGLEKRRRERPKSYRVRARALGLRPGLDHDRISDLLEQLEGPAAR